MIARKTVSERFPAPVAIADLTARKDGSRARADDAEMIRYIPDLAAQPAPRYTSFPPADRFSDRVAAPEQAEALAAVVPGTPVSVYVHIPYCHEICWYCGCNTGAIGRQDRLDAYVEALEAEIDTVAARLSGHMVSLHFGGGTPNSLSADQIGTIVQRLGQRFGRSSTTGIAIELDPRHSDADGVAALAQVGVTRISLGVQTFADHVQRRINRVQPFEQVAEIVAAARGSAIGSVNFDLLYGLPDQTLADIEATIDQTLELRPDRIAAFGYAHLPRLIPRQRMILTADLPDTAARFAQSVAIHDRLVEAGYQAVGFDHFALPDDDLAIAAREGRLHRNFQGFTNEPCEVLIGIGTSAISQFPDRIIQNEKHVGAYRDIVLGGRLAATKGVVISPLDHLRGHLIERLLCDGAVDLPSPGGMVDAWRGRLDRFVDLGLAEWHGGRLTVTPAGRPYARLIAASFDDGRAMPGSAAPTL